MKRTKNHSRWIAALALMLSLTAARGALAAGYTNWAVPTQIMTTGDGGILVYGAFGNPAQCAVADKIHVQNDTNQLKLVEGMVLTALATGKAVQFYVVECSTVEDDGDIVVNRAYQSRRIRIR